MTFFLEGPLAAKIGKAFASIFYPCTLTRSTPAAPDPAAPWAPGEPETTAYPCLGMVEAYSDYAIANSIVDAQDRKVMILASSLTIVPTDLDTVTIRGASYRVLQVKTDPGRAVWELRVRS
jgi:hypothetical protein